MLLTCSSIELRDEQQILFRLRERSSEEAAVGNKRPQWIVDFWQSDKLIRRRKEKGGSRKEKAESKRRRRRASILPYGFRVKPTQSTGKE
ncbi:hypothetical protein HPP92_017256 [Vanilla planifolia]|uniref:Uncharacterized protein n=1 Tax=Vanilla planifolia TaxID=51239 RepID=A0A835QFQ3_VANPL|nr:hypothetical protein HPP92_017256 [Vanilla planifolia]